MSAGAAETKLQRGLQGAVSRPEGDFSREIRRWASGSDPPAPPSQALAGAERRLAMGALARGGLPLSAALLRKATLVEALPETGQLPVRTLTFAAPPALVEGFRIDHGDVLKVVVPGVKAKSYSISSMRPGEFDVTIKVYPGGACSGYLDSVQVGEAISVFKHERANKERRPGTHVGVVAFGVGVTEALPVAKAEAEKPDARQVHLLWGARTLGDMFWREECERLEREHRGKVTVTRILSREDRDGCLKGRIDAGVLADLFGSWAPAGARFLVVGTKAMMREAERNLEAAGFPWPASALLLKPK